MDEIFYYDGQWYLYKPPVFELPPFDLTPPYKPLLGSYLWSIGLTPPSPIIISGV